MEKNDADKNCEGSACPRWLCRGIIIGNNCCVCHIECRNMTDWLTLSDKYFSSIFCDNSKSKQSRDDELKDEKNQVAGAVLSTSELMRFIHNISMLGITKDDKITVEIFNHEVPANSWSVLLFAKNCHRNTVIRALVTGNLMMWKDKFCIKMHYDENNLPPIPKGYEVVDEYEHLEHTDRFLYEGMWISATEPFIEMSAVITEKSVYHGNVPVIRKKLEEEN